MFENNQSFDSLIFLGYQITKNQNNLRMKKINQKPWLTVVMDNTAGHRRGPCQARAGRSMLVCYYCRRLSSRYP